MISQNIAKGLLERVGNTPMVALQTIGSKQSPILAKMESYNPGGSVKDRIALNMILEAERSGQLQPGSVVIEPTSGNTGIGLAWVCALRGYRLILTMPETMSRERRKIVKAYGAETVLTPAEEGMYGSVQKALELSERFENVFVPSQFDNPANPAVHYETTGPEIWCDTEGELDILVAGIGTGGTISGTGRFLKEQNPAIRIVGIEPANSAVISGETPGPHAIMGIGAGFVPNNFDKTVVDELISVTDNEAALMTKRLAREEGLLAGISSGAAAHVSEQLSHQSENQGKTIVTILPDTGERYLTIPLFDD